MVNKPSLTCFVLSSLALVLACACSLSSANSLTGSTGIKSILPEISAKELKMSLKMSLIKMKLRRVPLAKERSEKLLAKLYREERIIQEQIDDLKRNLMSAGTDASSRGNLKVLETNRASKDDKQAGVGRRNLMVLSDLTQGRIDEWRAELAKKERELDEVKDKKEEAKNIIKDPESYISIPTNYGRQDPEEVQEREREILIRDRENMGYRAAVEGGKETPPTWMTDHW